MQTNMNEEQPSRNNRNLLLRYAGLAFQLLTGIGLGIYAGMWLDNRIKMGTPLLVWILPLVVIAATLYKVIKDTSDK